MIIREIGASLRALFARLGSKSTTIAGTETLYLDDAGSSVKAALSDVIRYGGGNSTRVTTIGNANIHQKSDGTLWLEVAGQTAGNARGAGAFDWQAVRTGATQVASGTSAISIGTSCTASGNDSLALGVAALAAGTQSIALMRSIANSNSSFAAVTSTANGSSSVVLGAGSASASAATSSVALGARCLTTNPSQLAVCGPETLPVGSGQAQANIQTFYTVTTDATSTPLNIINTVTARMVIPATRSCAFIGIVQAMVNVSSSSNFLKAWKIEGVITRDGSNNTRIVGTPTITVMAQDADGTPTPSTWAIASITADDTNEALAINVTGQTGQTIRWQATLLYSQVGF